MNDQKPASSTTADTSTCADRLRALAGHPKFAEIRWELLHSAAELDGMREALRNAVGETAIKAVEEWKSANAK